LATSALVNLGNFLGANVTIPHKEEILKYLDDISKEAKVVGAVNTIVIKETKILGYNTDITGFIKSLEEKRMLNSIKRVIILGCGGAGRAIAVGLLLHCQPISLMLRDIVLNKAKKLKKDIILNLPQIKEDTIKVIEKEEELREVCKDMDMIVNASGVGLKPYDSPILVKDWLSSSTLFYDLIYNPPLTPFLNLAKEIGACVMNGLEMLLYQGAASFQLWTQKEAPLDIMRSALSDSFRL
jgi:shikimate dehydrogenase